MSRRRLVRLLGVLAVVAGGGLAIVRFAGMGYHEDDVPSVLVGRGTVEAYVRVQGIIDSREKTTVRARTAGLVIIVLVKEGDLVKTGTTLLRFDRVEAAERLIQQQQQVQAAQAELEHARQEHRRIKKLVERKLEAFQKLDNAKLRSSGVRMALSSH